MHLYHTTPAAETILREGFRESASSFGFATVTLTGVFLSRAPASCGEGAKGDQVLEVAFDDAIDLSPYAITEQGQVRWEWCVPADLIAAHGTLRLLTEGEIDEIDW